MPETAFVPLQPPDAVHEVAFVDVHVNLLLAPLATDVGDADSVTVGAGGALVTVTETLARDVRPLLSVQLIVKVELRVNALVLSLPESVFPPLHAPDATHAPRSLDQVNLVVLPELTEVGLAEIVTVGARL